MQHSNSRESGFILPALVVFSLILASMGVIALQYVTASSNAIASTSFTDIAKSAADAGIQHALSCLEEQSEEWIDPLKPNTDCAGEENGHSDDLSQSGAWRSTYEVEAMDTTTDSEAILITSTGRVEFFYAGASEPSKTFTATSKASVPINNSGQPLQMASGNVVTKVSAGDAITCAIANMQLYCSGERKESRMGDGTNRSDHYQTPTRINMPPLTDKYITDIQVGSNNHCAIATGQSYCWGRNNTGSAGNGTTNPTYIIPTTPTDASGFTGAQTRLASPGKSWNTASSYTCFLNQLRVFCSGANSTAQLGRVIIQQIGASLGIRDKPDFTTTSSAPLRVYGFDVGNETATNYNNSTFYSQSKLFQSRPTHVDSGAYQACTLINSRVFCWGDRFVSGGADVSGAPADIGNVKATSGWRGGNSLLASSIGVGESTSCLVSSGKLYCWGWRPGNGTTGIGASSPTSPHSRWNLVNTSDAAPELSGVNIEGFNSHSDNYMCAHGDGDAYCWGPGSNLGNASPSLNSPAKIIAGDSTSGGDRPNITDVSAGRDQICAVANGSMYCRGHNNYIDGNNSRRGMLGTTSSDDFTTSNYTRKANSIGNNGGIAATSLASGADHSCAIANKYVYCWGLNNLGQLGNGEMTNSNQPQSIEKVTGLNERGATHVATGLTHSCAIISGDIYCWGRNNHGQLGQNPSTTPYSSTPMKVELPDNSHKATSITAGNFHTCAVAGGRAYCWGRNNEGQLGRGNFDSINYPTPQQVVNLSSGIAKSRDNPSGQDIPTQVTAGANFTCAIANAYAYCWGQNSHGQIGRSNSTVRYTSPQLINHSTEFGWTSLDAGDNFVCGILERVMRCWGQNNLGQLGRNNTSTYEFTPANVVSSVAGQTVSWKYSTKVTAGRNHACAIADGEAYCWGANASGQLGDGTTSSFRNNSQLVQRIGNYLGDNNIYDISAGVSHTCGIANGRIICWGQNDLGQLGNGQAANTNVPNTWQADYIRKGRMIDIYSATVF